MRVRSGIILIEGNQLALIERHRAGKHYFALPGGGVDAGETFESAAIREAYEELGLTVVIQQKIAEIHFNESHQHYFLVKKIAGEFGAGAGEEYGEYDPIHGTYNPLWMPVSEILNNNVLPRGLAQLIVRSVKNGWSVEPVIITEQSE